MHINTFDIIIGNGIRTEVNNCLHIKLILIIICIQRGFILSPIDLTKYLLT